MSELKPAMPANVRPLRGGTEPSRREWDCSLCFGTGAVLANRSDLPMAAPFAYRCTCGRGRNDRRSYPILDAQGHAVERIEGALLKPVEVGP